MKRQAVASIDLGFLQSEEVGRMPQTARRFAMQYCQCASKTLEVLDLQVPHSPHSNRRKKVASFQETLRSAKQMFLTDLSEAKSDSFGAAHLVTHVNPRGVG